MELDILRKQHKVILDIVSEIYSSMNQQVSEESCKEIVTLLQMLADKLESHLRIEDNILYPTLLESSSKDIRRNTIIFKNSIADIAKGFENYITKWDENRIQKEYQFFVDESDKVLKLLSDRVEKEDHTLFTYLENMDFKKYF